VLRLVIIVILLFDKAILNNKSLVTTKLVHRNKRNELIDAQSDDKTTKDLVNMAILVPRSKAAIVVETRAEKVERKILAQERKQERLIEQQKLAQHMENLMEKVFLLICFHEIVPSTRNKVLREAPLTKKDEDNLRHKIQTIVTKVKKDSEKVDGTSAHLSSIEPSSSSSRIKSDVSISDYLTFF
jgi:hypothetical protein